MHRLGVVERRQDDGDHVPAGRQCPRRVTFDPGLDMALLELRDRQRPAELAELVEIPHRVVAMAFANRAIACTPAGNTRCTWSRLRRRSIRLPGPVLPSAATGRHAFMPGQGQIGTARLFLAADSLAVLVEQWHAALRARRRIVPAIGLLPVPSLAVALPTCSWMPFS